MADHFVDSANGNNGNSGHTMDAAWLAYEYAQESGSLVAGDIVWVRRNVAEVPTSDIVFAYDGSAGNPIRSIGCPRPAIPNTTITSASWTNGSTTVDLIIGITCARRQHQGRYVTAPNGSQYQITRVVDSNTVIIDTEYAGSTVTLTDGKFQIEADEDYTLFNAIDDSAWTIKKSDWNGDAINLPQIDFNDGDFQMALSSDYYHDFANMEIKDSTDYSGVISISACGVCKFTGCLFAQNTISDILFQIAITLVICKRCIFEGAGAGSTNVGVYAINGGKIALIDCAVYNFGDFGLRAQAGRFYLENVNIGVEIANGDADIGMRSPADSAIFGRDVKLGGTNGYVEIDASFVGSYEVTIENYGKVLGEHKSFYVGGTWERAAVSGETPNKKVSDNVIKITPNINYPYPDEAAQIIFTDEFKVTTDQKSYKYWLYNDTGAELNDSGADIGAKADIWLELEYVDVYDDTTEYIIKKEYSAEIDIADAADADDWDYLQITNITPAVASKLRIICRCRNYVAAGDIFIDEAVVIS